MSKRTLLELVDTERAIWYRSVEHLEPHQMEVPSVCGDWSVKDIIAHIAWFEDEMVGMLRTRALEGVDAARFAGMPADWQPWKAIAGNTFEHYRDHGHGVRAWLAKQA